MKNETSILDLLLIIVIFVSIIIALISSVLFIIFFKYVFIHISMITLFLVGSLTLMLVLKDNQNKDVYKYVIMDKDEYEIMKSVLYKQKSDLKKLKTAIKNK